MPYPTFFHLPDSKRQRIMRAVWEEFTNYSYMDASINRIIQSAEISRGSFYQYFSCKQDLFSYVLNTIYENGKKMFLAQLTAHNNDLFFAILGMYDMILWKKGRASNPEQQQIQSLVRLNANLDMCQFAMRLDCESIVRDTSALLQQSGYTVDTPQECSALLHMLVAITTTGLANTMRHPHNEERNRKLLEQQLLIIRRGLAPCGG